MSIFLHDNEVICTQNLHMPFDIMCFSAVGVKCRRRGSVDILQKFLESMPLSVGCINKGTILKAVKDE